MTRKIFALFTLTSIIWGVISAFFCNGPSNIMLLHVVPAAHRMCHIACRTDVVVLCISLMRRFHFQSIKCIYESRYNHLANVLSMDASIEHHH